MSDEVTVAFHLAWLVGIWHMLVAGYMVFMSGSKHGLLLSIALVKGVLGGLIYVIVREPEWVVYPSQTRVLLPVTLFVIFVFSVLVTAVLFRAFDLEPPTKRLRRLHRMLADDTN